MTTRQRIGADLTHVVSARLARADRRLDRLDLVDVNDGLLSVAADVVIAQCGVAAIIIIRR